MADTPNLAALESRLAKLERRNRLLTTCLAAALAIGVFTAAKTASQPGSFSEVRAHRFVLLDDRGVEVGKWHTDDQRRPSLSMGRIFGNSQITLAEEGVGPALRMGNKAGGEIGLSIGEKSSVVTVGSPPLAESRRARIALNAGPHSSVSVRGVDLAQINVSPGSHPIESIRPGGMGRDWYFTRGSLWLNGMGIRLNNANGDPIQVLPQRPLPQTTEAPQKRFPLFGPRR